MRPVESAHAELKRLMSAGSRPRRLDVWATEILDASGYPAALTEAIARLKDIRHEPTTVRYEHGWTHGDQCVACGQPLPCATARFLAEHDETT